MTTMGAIDELQLELAESYLIEGQALLDAVASAGPDGARAALMEWAVCLSMAQLVLLTKVARDAAFVAAPPATGDALH